MMASNFAASLGHHPVASRKRTGVSTEIRTTATTDKTSAPLKPTFFVPMFAMLFMELFRLLRWTGTINVAYEEVNNISLSKAAKLLIGFPDARYPKFRLEPRVKWLYT